MACEALFRQAFPKWWTTRDAATTLQRMDAFIEQLLDPNRYHSHLAQVRALTSTPLHPLRTASAPPPHRLRSSSRAQRPSASLRATSSASSRVPTALASTLPRRSSRPRCPAATVRCHLVQLRGRGRGRGKGGPQWHCRARLGTSAPLQTSAAPSAPCHASVCLCRCLATPPYFWPDAASRRGAARTAHLGRGGAAAALPDRRPPPRRRQLVRESAQPDDRPPTTQEPRFPAKDPIVGRGRCYKVVCRSPETWAVLASRERVSECCEGTSARVHMCGPPGGSLTVPRLGATRATPVLYLGYPLSIIIKPYNALKVVWSRRARASLFRFSHFAKGQVKSS